MSPRRQQTAVQSVCRCGTPTRDGASVCEECLTVLYNLLTDDVPWLDEELDVSISGQRSVHFQPGHASASGSTDVLLNRRASAARRRLHRVLAQWVKFCLTHDVRNSAPDHLRPPDTTRDQLRVMAEWLSWRVDGLAWWPEAYHARSGLEAAVNHAREVVLWKPPVRIFLGKCGLPISIEDKNLRCPGDVYAAEDATALDDVGHCRTCGQAHLVAGMRAKLEAELDGRLCTAAEIARMMVYLGADGASERLRGRVRNRINQWHSRGVITPTPCAATREDGEPRYRYGDVKSRLAAEFKREEAS
jgi:hypothetical protein